MEEIILNGKTYVLKEKQVEEDYIVGDYENVKFDEHQHNLVFKNGCVIQSSFNGDGVYIGKEYVKTVYSDEYCVYIVLKGSERTIPKYAKILYDANEK